MAHESIGVILKFFGILEVVVLFCFQNEFGIPDVDVLGMFQIFCKIYAVDCFFEHVCCDGRRLLLERISVDFAHMVRCFRIGFTGAGKHLTVSEILWNCRR